jgi:FkbM family methyltransferase
MPFLTCIVLSHDKAPYVGEAIDSLVTQTFSDWEAVLIDSGVLFDQGFFDRIPLLRDPRFRVIRSKETEHLRRTKTIASWCFNECFRHGLARGEFVTYLCDDDLYYPHAFQTFHDHVQMHPETMAMYASLDRTGKTASGKTFHFQPPLLATEVKGSCCDGGKLDCQVDYLQLCHKVELLGRFPSDEYWPEDRAVVRHADGLFLERIGSLVPIYPIKAKIGQNRKVPSSLNDGGERLEYFARWYSLREERDRLRCLCREEAARTPEQLGELRRVEKTLSCLGKVLKIDWEKGGRLDKLLRLVEENRHLQESLSRLRAESSNRTAAVVAGKNASGARADARMRTGEPVKQEPGRMRLPSLMRRVFQSRAATTPVPHPGGDKLGSPHLPDYLAWSRTQMEAECRRLCQSTYLGDNLLLCRVLGKYMVFADARDIGIVPHLCLDGYWETWITQAVVRVLRPGWRCVDVGANHGYFTLLFADAVGPEGQVLACEPNPEVVELLDKTLTVNGFNGRVSVIREAMGESDGDYQSLIVPPERSMNAFTRPSAPEGIPLQTLTLDTLCRSLDRVDLVKIDAEGAEEYIWRGMIETVERNPEITVLLEFKAARYSDPHAFLADIQVQGFPLRYVDYDSDVKPVTAEQVLLDRPNTDWMLWLQRPLSDQPV